MNSRLWAVTSYFNPAGYSRRLENYRVFRQRLNAPLVTVELSYTGDFALAPGDADVLVRLRGESVLWQKERLLNIAAAHLPPVCDQVAWLDCDIVFGQDDWAAKAGQVLESMPLCQLYRQVFHLAPDAPIGKENSQGCYSSFGLGLATNGKTQPRSATDYPGEFKRGHAWAAWRSLLDTVGLYDRGVVGGGDKFIAFAAAGRWEEIIGHTGWGEAQASDYREWSQAFHGAVGARIGYVDIDLFHLWHGDLRNRRYDQRQWILVEHGFDPRRDIALDRDGCWRWNSPKPELHRAVKEYFRQRKEDGE